MTDYPVKVFRVSGVTKLTLWGESWEDAKRKAKKALKKLNYRKPKPEEEFLIIYDIEDQMPT